MTTKHMRVFLKVYETSNITEAARQLYMTQPAVTRIIQDLESHYGLRLFDRINQRLYATPAASEFYQKAVHIVATLDDMETTMRNWDQLGVLRVGASITLGNFLMPRLASEMKRTHPQLSFRVQIARGEKLHSLLLSNTLDLAIIEHNVPDDYLVCEPFSSDHLTLIFAPDHPFAQRKSVTLAELAQEPLLMREPGSVGRNFACSVFESHGLRPQILWESSSTQALSRATRAGLGVSLLPDALVRDDIAAGHLCSVPVENVSFARTHYIIRHKNKFLSPSMLDFIALCHACADSSK